MDIFEASGIPVEESEPAVDLWFVLAYWKEGKRFGHWRLFEQHFETQATAEEYAKELIQRGWRFLKLIHYTNNKRDAHATK